MFLSHIGIALELIALGFGAGLILWALQHKGLGHSFAKITGIIIMVLASIILICSIYTTTHMYRNYALFMSNPMVNLPMMNDPMGNMMMQSGSCSMMNGGMCQCPMGQHPMNKMGHH